MQNSHADDFLQPLVAETEAAEDALQEVKDHLLIAPPLVWLDVIARCDADRHDALIRWMLDQPECDFAVAFVAFHLGTPAYYLRNNISICRNDPHRKPLALQVLEHWDNGHFQIQDLGVEPSYVGGQVQALVKTINDIAPADRLFHVPPGFLVLPQGPTGPLSPEWSADHDTDIHDMYAAAGLRTDLASPADAPVKDIVEWRSETPKKSFWSSINFLQ